MSGFVLTDENYYSREADILYMSCSQFQSFQTCEAATMARLRGEWEPKGTNDALFQGQYFHSYFESPEAFTAFCNAGFDKIFKTKTTKARGTEIVGKYAPFERLDEMIRVVESDPFMSRVLEWSGENEKFLTGEIGGIPWRMKMDKYTPQGRRIIDYKTSANIWELYYNPESKERQSFIEEYGYTMRAAVYGEIERQNVGADTFPTFIILAVSKQDPPDKGAFCLNDDARWAYELEKVKAAIPRIQQLKEGHLAPRRCGHCEYCRATKRINGVMMYTDLMPAYRGEAVEYDEIGPSLYDTL